MLLGGEFPILPSAFTTTSSVVLLEMISVLLLNIKNNIFKDMGQDICSSRDDAEERKRERMDIERLEL